MLATRIRGVGVSGQELTGDTTEFLKEEHPGPVVDGEQAAGGWIVEWSECPQDREEMGKDDQLQAVGVPGRGRVR